jgi:hypothetical protein
MLLAIKKKHFVGGEGDLMRSSAPGSVFSLHAPGFI